MSTEEAALTCKVVSVVIVHLDTPEKDAKPTSMNVHLLHARTRERVLTIPPSTSVPVCKVSVDSIFFHSFIPGFFGVAVSGVKVLNFTDSLKGKNHEKCHY